LGIVREWFMRGSLRWCRCCRDHDDHSLPLRVDVDLPPLNTSEASVAAAAGAPPASPPSSRRFCTVHTIALFYDNYAYLIVDRSQGDRKPYPCALVDPADADGVLKELKRLAVAEYGAERGAPLEQTLQVEAILTTHKHWDHAWGNRKLTNGKALKPPPVKAKAGGGDGDEEEEEDERPRIRVFGGKYDDVDRCTDYLDEGDKDCVVGSLLFEILHTPCHTAGSIMFLLRGHLGRDILFTGDSLFVGGVGAHFEGSQEDSSHNMRTVWLNCSPQALIFAGHEYTLECLQDRFSGGGRQPIPSGKRALSRLTSALHRATVLRARRLPTVPATLGEEVGYNSAFDWLHNSATLLQETWRRFKVVELALEEAEDHGGARMAHVVPWTGPRSALIPGPQWVRGGGSGAAATSSASASAAAAAVTGSSNPIEIDFQDDAWISEHAQQLWSLGTLVEVPGAAATVGQQLRTRADQLRENVSGDRANAEAEQADSAQKGTTQQALKQGGDGVRFVWGSSAADKARIKAERQEQADRERRATCRSCRRRCCCCSCCRSEPGNSGTDVREELTASEAARAISTAAAACIPSLQTPGAPGVTPGASALRRKAAADRETLSSALPRLEAANRVMQAISDGVEQDREAAEDILGAFVDIGGDEDDGTIEVGVLSRALTELGDERTVLSMEDVGDILHIYDVNVEGGLPGGPDGAQPDTSERFTTPCACLPACLVCLPACLLPA
jgi:hydroxyacylglutathione hydrolase